MRKSLAFLIVILLLSLPVRAATVRIAYVEWDCATATSNLVKAALESRGHSVDLLSVSAAAMWLGVANGDVDATVSAWLPVTHGAYLKRNARSVEDLGTIVRGVRLGLAVPDYVPLTSIDELKDKAALFGGRIVGIDPGAGLMSLAEKAISGYGLKMDLMEGSGATMATALGEAVRNREPIVVTAWSPHWMFGRWPLRYLDDPKGIFGDNEAIHTVGRKGLQNDLPEVYAFLKRFHFSDIHQLEELMMHNATPGGDPLRNAVKFMEANPELVASWFAAP